MNLPSSFSPCPCCERIDRVCAVDNALYCEKCQCTFSLILAQKIKCANRQGERNAKIAARHNFIDERPEVPQRQLAREMKAAGLYSAATFVGDIEPTIIRRRAARIA
jgi:hypothetical protein